jgi:hypothetical protein
VHQFMLSFGPAVTFVIASIVLLGVTAILRAVLPPPAPAPVTPEGAVALPSLVRATVALLVGIGLMTDLVVRIGFENSSRVLAANWPQADPEWLNLLIGVGITAIALPAGLLATRFGNRLALRVALVATAVLSGLLSLLPVGLIPTLAVIALGVTLPFILNGGIAFSLSIVPPQKAGLGIGLYLSGTAIGLGLFSLPTNPNNSLLVSQGLLLEIVICLVTTLWITTHKTPQLQ